MCCGRAPKDRLVGRRGPTATAKTIPPQPHRGPVIHPSPRFVPWAYLCAGSGGQASLGQACEVGQVERLGCCREGEKPHQQGLGTQHDAWQRDPKTRQKPCNMVVEKGKGEYGKRGGENGWVECKKTQAKGGELPAPWAAKDIAPGWPVNTPPAPVTGRSERTARIDKPRAHMEGAWN